MREFKTKEETFLYIKNKFIKAHNFEILPSKEIDKKKLIDMVTIWKTLSNVMTSKPEEIIFSNAPSKYGSIPMDLFNTPSFNWEEIPKLEIMAQLIQELRAEQSHLEDVQLKLRF